MTLRRILIGLRDLGCQCCVGTVCAMTAARCEHRLRDFHAYPAGMRSARSNLRMKWKVCANNILPLRNTTLRDLFGVCAGGLHDHL